jgi:type IV secretory pathway VirB10-like protein
MKQLTAWAAIALAVGFTVGACGQALARQADPQRTANTRGGASGGQKSTSNTPPAVPPKKRDAGGYVTDEATADDVAPDEKKSSRSSEPKTSRDSDQRRPAER